MYYFDANVFIYAVYETGPIGMAARKIIKLLEENKFSAITSTLTLDEVIFSLRKVIGYSDAINHGENIFKIFNLKIVPVIPEDIMSAFVLMKHGLKPRDAIHAAVAVGHGVFTIVSEDRDFDKYKDLSRLSFSEFLKKF